MGEEAIAVRGLKKIYKTGFFLKPFTALEGITFSVNRNEIYGFLGPNGAGKTTTIKILNSIVFPTEGEVEIFGETLGGIKNKYRIGYLPEQPYFYEYLSSEEFLSFCGNLFGLRKREIEERIDNLLHIVGLVDAKRLQLRKFSKGMLQRIGIAQALINDPDLVILDEPMSGLDPIGRMEIRELIRNLKEKGKTVFFSSHIISDVELLADRICILDRGAKIAEGNIEELIGNMAIKYYEINVKGVHDTGLLVRELGQLCVDHYNRGSLLVIRVFPEDVIDEAIEVIKSHGGKITGIIPVRINLEELFMEKIRERVQ
jgi:ABC-2 type transport system ATP-binding protein